MPTPLSKDRGASPVSLLLAWARQRYDLVVIDSPPSQRLMDAHLLASQADMVLFCARWGHSSLEAVAGDMREMRQAGDRIIGAALGIVKLHEYCMGQLSCLCGPTLRASPH